MHVARTSQPDEPAAQETAQPAKTLSSLRFKLAVLQYDRAVYRFARRCCATSARSRTWSRRASAHSSKAAASASPSEWLFKVARNPPPDRNRP
jgi:hypothetical protein